VDVSDYEGLTSSRRQGATSTRCLKILTGNKLVFQRRGWCNIGWGGFAGCVVKRRKSNIPRRREGDEPVVGSAPPGV
jgi:hypothetical protein